jgi:hypothetical protein
MSRSPCVPSNTVIAAITTTCTDRNYTGYLLWWPELSPNTINFCPASQNFSINAIDYD